MGKKTSFSTVLLTAVFLVFLPLIPASAKAGQESDRYLARTADCVELVTKRYRPDQGASFGKSGQPVIPMPGFIANFNEFDIRTPAGKDYGVQLPPRPASWVRDDPYIRKDHTKYYSLAHYLWAQGYGVWLANCRGEGREPYPSGGAGAYRVDDLGVYDLPALIREACRVTGRHPVWIGHSMGATMACVYLQGAAYDPEGSGHVISDPALAAATCAARWERPADRSSTRILPGKRNLANGTQTSGALLLRWEILSASRPL
jgi:hypothetical protein